MPDEESLVNASSQTSCEILLRPLADQDDNSPPETSYDSYLLIILISYLSTTSTGNCSSVIFPRRFLALTSKVFLPGKR